MRPSKYRWVVFSVFFLFMLLHQSDKLLIGPLTTSIQKEFGLDDTGMGAISTGSLIIAALFYPIWGYLYDRFARPKLLALASLIWGATTWLSAIARTPTAFLFTRASTGIDDSSYPGLYSLISDYFGPRMRGRVIGFLQLTGPFGYMIGMVLALMLGGVLGWRSIFYITGSLGILVAILIFFTIREVPRGRSEPEFEELAEMRTFKFEWKTVRSLFKKRGLLLMYVQGFFGVFPWNVITFWIFKYLETERHYSSDQQLVTMVPAIIIMAAGYPIGGYLGDRLFKRTPRGRLIIATIGVLSGAIMLWLTLSVPIENLTLFGIMLCLTGLFIPWAAPNVISTVYDVTLPEVRSSALSVQYFIESSGAALSPLIAGLISDQSGSLGFAILIICVSTWLLCGIFFMSATRFIPNEIKVLRAQLQERAQLEKPTN
jgi:MFS family permease